MYIVHLCMCFVVVGRWS